MVINLDTYYLKKRGNPIDLNLKIEETELKRNNIIKDLGFNWKSNLNVENQLSILKRKVFTAFWLISQKLAGVKSYNIWNEAINIWIRPLFRQNSCMLSLEIIYVKKMC